MIWQRVRVPATVYRHGFRGMLLPSMALSVRQAIVCGSLGVVHSPESEEAQNMAGRSSCYRFLRKHGTTLRVKSMASLKLPKRALVLRFRECLSLCQLRLLIEFEFRLFVTCFTLE